MAALYGNIGTGANTDSPLLSMDRDGNTIALQIGYPERSTGPNTQRVSRSDAATVGRNAADRATVTTPEAAVLRFKALNNHPHITEDDVLEMISVASSLYPEYHTLDPADFLEFAKLESSAGFSVWKGERTAVNGPYSGIYQMGTLAWKDARGKCPRLNLPPFSRQATFNPWLSTLAVYGYAYVNERYLKGLLGSRYRHGSYLVLYAAHNQGAFDFANMVLKPGFKAKNYSNQSSDARRIIDRAVSFLS